SRRSSDLDLLEGALQPWPVVLTVRRRRLRLAHPHHTAAHEPQRVWIAAGLGRRLAYHVDRFINTAEVNAAAAHPAVGEPTGAAQRRQGGRTKEDRRMRSLHGLRLGRGPRNGVELAVMLHFGLCPQCPESGDELLRAPSLMPL